MNTTKVDLILKNGLLVTDNFVEEANLAIKDGKIVGIFNSQTDVEADEIRDIEGLAVFPGLIDTHAHYWEPGPQNYREDFYHATRASAAGGVTTALEMPLSIPPVTDETSFKLKYGIAKKNSVIDFGLWGGLIPSSIDNLELLNSLGCCAYKAFISYANPDYPHMPDHELCRAMEEVAKFDGLIGVHAENADIVSNFCRRMEEAGIMDPSRYHEGRPPFAEVEAIERAMLFARQYGVRLLICHMSAAEGVESTRRARMLGQHVYTETCPHYLAFDNTIMSKCKSFAKCNPPLRPAANLEALWKHVLHGDIDVIGTDHGPYSKEEKLKANDNIWEALPGFGGVELMLPVLLTEGYHKRNMPLEAIARISSINAAKIFELENKGGIQVGKDADLTIVDLNAEWSFEGMKSFSKTKIDCGIFEGYRSKGKVIETIVRGRTVYRDGEITIESGYGKFVPRHCNA
jgi:allantoinase